ncbi:hypothetical protein NDU88_003465 [Pleurodeles waltl]|uniref:Uncharacterized protein n=1 Tax=Pleurodeles waltl TaxID=8319 RepID=A0AAV7Q931_PLEWA|nr:hypothetical protein NDU88_003465 [Pleurodeles waltl]
MRHVAAVEQRRPLARRNAVTRTPSLEPDKGLAKGMGPEFISTGMDVGCGTGQGVQLSKGKLVGLIVILRPGHVLDNDIRAKWTQAGVLIPLLQYVAGVAGVPHHLAPLGSIGTASPGAAALGPQNPHWQGGE